MKRKSKLKVILRENHRWEFPLLLTIWIQSMLTNGKTSGRFSFHLSTNLFTREKDFYLNDFFKVLLKTSIFDWIIFEYVSSVSLFVVFLLFNVQLISYAIFICQLFDSFSRLFVLTIFIWMSMTILSYEDFADISYLILSLNRHFCLVNVVRHLFLCEWSMRQLNWQEGFSRWSPILSNIFLQIIVTMPFFWILIWYLEELYPGLMKFSFLVFNNWWKQILSFEINMESVYCVIFSFLKINSIETKNNFHKSSWKRSNCSN